ncbi:neutral zinc metallopeptidase [Arthrobacter sp. UYEF20]|uniref:neutral zinc metallopeptidase n=1 Tax=Arthrobacter sp. UYEF20 TaxID=1756363 RepID=UPI0033923A4D
MARQLSATVPLLLAAMMLLTSCGPQGGTTPPPAETASSAPGTASPSDTASATSTPTATPGTLAPEPPPTTLKAATPATAEELAAYRDALYCPTGGPEGCHSYESMAGYFDHLLGIVAPMFDERYGTVSRPAAFYYVAAGVTGPTACLKDDGTPDPYSSADYSYCLTDRAIYTGQDALWALYKGVGYAAPAVAYAHEWGHHIQNIMKVPEPETPEENALLEKQADCIAGAWVQHAAQSGNLKYPADLGDLNALMAAVAPPDPGEEPTPVQERIDALQLGYTSGLPGCNSFFPETPVYAG